MKKSVIFILTVVVASAVLFTSKYIFKPEIKTVKAFKKKIVKAVYASGKVKPADQIDIKSEVSGYIKDFSLEEGDKVKKNQVIAKIENRTIDSLLDEIDKQIKRTEEKLQKDSEFRKQFENQIKIEKANLKLLEENYKRRLILYKKKQVSQEEIDNLKNQVEITKNKIKLLENQYKDKIKDLESNLQILKDKKKQILKEKEKYFIKTPLAVLS